MAIRRITLGAVATLALSWQVAVAGVVDPALYAAAPGDAVIDSGQMRLSREGTPVSSEVFNIIRRADGGRTIVGFATAADASFAIQARWDYDAKDQAIGARGWGKHGERAFEVTIAPQASPATVTITRAGGETEVLATDCTGCLVDMMPGALPQFAVARAYDLGRGGIQSTRWMAFMLHMDIRSFDVVINANHVKDIEARRSDGSTVAIRHFTFDESGTVDRTGEAYALHSNLWVDTDNRPIKFKAGRTIGLRAGYEDIDAQLAPQ